MVNNKYRILWADDEIDLLKPHLLFLRNKGYIVDTANNGRDALDLVAIDPTIDLAILDENMPGLTGLETLSQIKQARPELPVVMITKSEEENIMDQAVGNKIADYLIKPVNPNQILLAIKKILHGGQLVSQQASTDYRQEFANISTQINNASTIEDWSELYSKLVYWEMERPRPRPIWTRCWPCSAKRPTASLANSSSATMRNGYLPMASARAPR